MLHDSYEVETELFEALEKVDSELADKLSWLIDTAQYGDYDEDKYDDGKASTGFATRMEPVYEDEEDDGVNWDQPLPPVNPWTPWRPTYVPPVRRPEPVDDLEEDRSGPTGFAPPRPSYGW